MGDDEVVQFGLDASDPDAGSREPTFDAARRLTRIGPYAVQRFLGKGAMGVVVEAVAADGERLAIKLLRPQKNPERFLREVHTLRRLAHPNLIGCVDHGVGPEGPWLAMPLVEGQDLEEHLRTARPSPVAAAALVRDAAWGVAAAHAAGVVHRDLKPANLFLRRDGAVLVGDFGLALGADDVRLTRTGVLLGTLDYMAPEQAEDPRRAGPAADVWSLGAILYRLLAGRGPRDRERGLGALTDMSAPIQGPRSVDATIPVELDALCLRCLDPDPAARPTAAELAQRLEHVARGPSRRLPGRPRPAAPAPRATPLWLQIAPTAAVVALAVLAVGAWVRRAPAPEPGPAAPAPPELATHTWALGADAAPTLHPPGAWDRAGRRVTPLDPDARAALFQGQVRDLGAGRVEVDYSATLVDALRLHSLDPLRLVDDPAPLVGVVPGGVRVYAPNDHDSTVYRVGAARWRDPEGDLRFARDEAADPRAVDQDVLLLELEGLEARFDGRGRQVRCVGSLPLAVLPDHASHTLRYAPFSESRASFDDQPLTDAPGPVPPRDGAGVLLIAAEGAYRVEALRVRGVPAATDLPALATAPPTVGARLRATLRYRRLAGEGGPLLALVDGAGQERVRAEVTRDGLELSLAGALLAQVPLAAPDAGVLTLERDVDLLRVQLSGEGAPQVLELPAALPLGRGLRLAYGSRAASLELAEVGLDLGEDDPGRAAFDAEDPVELSHAARGAPPSPAVEARRWWFQALLSARHDLARRLGLSYAPRNASADLIAHPPPELPGLEGQREVWTAWLGLLALDREACLGAARALVAREGRGPARRRFEALRYTPLEALFGKIAWGYARQRSTPRGLEPTSMGYRRLALELARVLAEGPQLQDLGVDHALNVALVAEDAVRQRGTLEPDLEREATRAFEELSTLEPSPEVLPRLVEAGLSLCLSLGRYAEAVRFATPYLERPADVGLLERAPLTPQAWSLTARSLARLGRQREAIRVALLGCAARPGSVEVPNALLSLATLELEPGPDAALPGLRALALLRSAEALRPESPAGRAAREQARALAFRAGPDLDDQDLGSYVRACMGEADARDRLTGVARPFALLTRARLGEDGVRAALVEAAARSRLLTAVIASDPDLAPLLR
ncbi:MAG: serine/threonine-protein kinase [Planctomycetota bacterium]